MKSVHEGQKFLCPHCDYKGKWQANLHAHIKSVHEGQKFPCPQCDYKATAKNSLQTHMKSIHEGIKLPRPHCDYKATRKGHLKGHIKSKHEEEEYFEEDIKTEFEETKVLIESTMEKEYFEPSIDDLQKEEI